MTEQSAPLGVLTQVGIDVSDLARAEAFYSALLGVKRNVANDHYLNFEPLPGGLIIYLQTVPEKKSSKTRLHMDIVVKDTPAALAAVEALGGSRTRVFLGRGRGLDGSRRSGRQRALPTAGLGSVHPEHGIHDVQSVVYILGPDAVVGDEPPRSVARATLDTEAL